MTLKKIYTTDELLNDPVRWEKLLRSKPESYWTLRGKHAAHALWNAMRTSVPAYKAFLLQHDQNPRIKKTDTDWGDIPLLSKDTYLRKYPLPQLMWHGHLVEQQLTISATSGSTGIPYYFPRTRKQDLQYAAVAEMYLRANFSIHTRSTLYIVGWGMGVWIGGVFSYEAVRIVAERGGYPLSVITPGTSKEEILNAVKSLGHLYDQIIIGGYPPMIKDLVDEGVRQKISWKRYNTKFIFSAEGFSETFRDYIFTHAGLRNIYTDTLNHYGTVDLGTMAHETPVSILVRRLALRNVKLNERLFGYPNRQPTLAQYIPELFYFESVQGNVVCSAESGIPLVRYDLSDTGGVWTLDDIRRITAEFGIDLDEETRKAGLEHTVWNVPFVYVFERNDFTVKLYGANIYPQEIRKALEDSRFVDTVTGKYTMEVTYDEHMNQGWTVHIELQSGIRASVKRKACIQQYIVERLCTENSEFANNVKSVGLARMTPHIVCWPYKSAPLFNSSGKHHWVRKTSA